MNDPANFIDPEGTFYFLVVAPGAYTAAMALADLTMAYMLGQVAEDIYSEARRRGRDPKVWKPSPCRPGPLRDAPGMPGWEPPSGDPHKDKDFWKKPSNWDKMSSWQKFRWYAGKIAAAAASGGGAGT